MFWIGCRVKKVNGQVPENIGAEGVVVGLEYMPVGTELADFQLEVPCDIQVIFDRDVIAGLTQELYVLGHLVSSKEIFQTIPAGTVVPEQRTNLVPILPSGMESEDETNELYEPEKATA